MPRKRKLPESKEDVIEWFTGLRSEPAFDEYQESDWQNLFEKVRSHSITVDVLRTFKREDLTVLDVKLLGPQRAILNRIEDLNRSFRFPKGMV